jgi:hypothetical protein
MSPKTFHLGPWSLLLALGAAASGSACGEQPQESVENTAHATPVSASQPAAATPLEILLSQRSRPQLSPEQAALAPLPRGAEDAAPGDESSAPPGQSAPPRAAVPVDLSRSALPVALQGGNEAAVVGTAAPNRVLLDTPAHALAQDNLPTGRRP